jgi:hypothetical protein
VKRFNENDPPAIATPQPPDSALGNRPEHENVGDTIPTHLTHADSDSDTGEEELHGGGEGNDGEGSQREGMRSEERGAASSKPLSSIHSNEVETRGGRGGGRGGAGAGTAQHQDKTEMRKGWVAWMEEIACGQDVTVLVGEPVSGKPVTLTRQPQHAGSERGGSEENGIGADAEGSVLKVGGVVIVWSWQGHTSCADKQGPTDNNGAIQSDCVGLREVEETLFLSVKVDGSVVKMDARAIRKWKCSVETDVYAACGFLLLLPFSGEDSGLPAGHHSLTVSVTDGGGPGRTRIERRGGGGTEGYGFEGSRKGQAAADDDGLWSSPTISFEISAPSPSFFSSSSSSSSWESDWKQHASSRQLSMVPFYQQVAHHVYAANAADMSMSATSEKSMAGGQQERDRRGDGGVEQQK